MNKRKSNSLSGVASASIIFSVINFAYFVILDFLIFRSQNNARNNFGLVWMLEGLWIVLIAANIILLIVWAWQMVTRKIKPSPWPVIIALLLMWVAMAKFQ